MTAFFGATPNVTYTLAELTAGGKGFALGDRYVDQSGNGWIFVVASGAITGPGFVCTIDETYTAVMVTSTNAARGDLIGVASVAFASGEYGWLQTSGVFANVQVLASCAANARLNTTATAGALDDDGTAGSEVIDHLVLTTARAASQGNAPGLGANNAAIGVTL
jgi:hypothetical protein